MRKCTFFGHRDCTEDITAKLFSEIEKLIKIGVKTFYVGNNGGFDRKVYNVLCSIEAKYDISFYVVQAYLGNFQIQGDKSIMPDGFETVPKRFAIDHRNKWMLNNSDFVVCYIRQNYGGAYKFVTLAKKQNKTIIEIS